MLPLGKTNDLPGNADEWVSALAAALPIIVEADSIDPARIKVSGAGDGRIESLEIDMSGLNFRTDISGIKFSDADSALKVTIGDLVVKAEPGKLAGVPANVRLAAKHVLLTGSQDQNGDLWLIPSRNNESVAGTFSVDADPGDVEKAVGAILAAQAKSNGVTLQDFRMKINAVSPKSAVVGAIAKGKKFGMSAVIEVAGNAEVDSDLRLVLSGLSAKGDGAFGTMAAKMLEPRLTPWNDRKINLSLPGFERVKVTSVEIADKPRLKLSSEFGAG
jgi:hypothetical protein